MKTQELVGNDLNRAVARALGHKLVLNGFQEWKIWSQGTCFAIPNYAGDITAAWPLIQKYRINIGFTSEEGVCSCMSGGRTGVGFDDDALVAAMRALVHCFLGEEMELP